MVTLGYEPATFCQKMVTLGFITFTNDATLANKQQIENCLNHQKVHTVPKVNILSKKNPLG